MGLPIAFLGLVTLRSRMPVLALLPLAALAQQTPRTQTGEPENRTPLTLAQALELADSRNPRLRAAEAGRAGATAGILSARAYPNPEWNFLSGNQRIRLNGAYPGFLQHYSVGQTIELSSLRRARIGTAEAARDASDFTLAETRLAVRGTVRQAFFEVLRRRGEVEIAQETVRLIEDLRRRVEVQVNVGEAARLELVRAEAEVAIARTAFRAAQLRLVTARSALSAAMGTPLGDREPAGSLTGTMILDPLESIKAQVLAQHPALGFVRAQTRTAQGRLHTERELRKPQPALRAEFEQQPDLGFFRVGVSLPVPLWNRREGPIAEAAAALEQARAIEEVRRVELTAAVERAYRQYEVAAEQVASFESGVLREAEAALQAAEAAFKFGERGIIEVLDAQRVLRTVRNDYLNAQFDREAALIELEQLQAVQVRTTP